MSFKTKRLKITTNILFLYKVFKYFLIQILSVKVLYNRNNFVISVSVSFINVETKTKTQQDRGIPNQRVNTKNEVRSIRQEAHQECTQSNGKKTL